MARAIAIADDPIIACMMRTGLPPWQIGTRYPSLGSYFPGCDVYDPANNEYDDEEDPDEHDDYYRNFFEPPMAIYEGESYDYF